MKTNKLIILATICLFITITTHAQFRIQNDGEIRFSTDASGPWDNTFITYPGSPQSKCYVVDPLGGDGFFVTGRGEVFYNDGVLWSDSTLKTDIANINNALENLIKLKGVSYKKKSEIKYLEKDHNKAKKHYGLIAQEVEKVFPELVSEGDKNKKGISYISLVPVLIEALKEQQSEIETLQQQIIVCCGSNNKEKSKSKEEGNSSLINTSASLEQNNPNPFTENTTINYFLPDHATSASIILYNMNGSPVKNIPLSGTGAGNIVIEGSELNPGMYMYALIVDNKHIDTKNMILTE
jgi:hypothetical protein